ncbi:Heme/copper-type cytochrome/quinol oxidase [Candidatus Terasakiella magnetica]|uniref:Heme/copper-type cytochrome/quinol oxidase n=1 Tax=Candidatus Terasakiella magnetica TaxID=1867952 RepID=A0A1C3RC92_9PROT|nr:cbb3-type cytochrome c oxidase subunit I [Candidatus Terasakiella magnetica]SCA54868.1 Heme/copper-type cytochrome/quinol oxidase [Candidatus Terasakiella magnetica]
MTLRQECKAWTLISVGALAIAGIFALLLVLSRTPGVQDILPWPWKSFFHKGLVTHVVFSFVVWFLATMGAIMCLSYAKQVGIDQESQWGKGAVGLAMLGCLGLIIPALFDLGTAELNNYIPVMNHPIYYGGLVLLLAGLVLVTLRQFTLSWQKTNQLSGTQTTGIIYLIAVLCMGLAFFYMPEGLPDPTFNEQLFWGGGHVLQFVNTALLFLAWMVIVKTATGLELMPRKYVYVVFGLLVIFCLPAPAIYFLFDILSQTHRDFYTEMLRYGLPLPSIIVSAFLLIFLLSRASRELDKISRLALWLSLFTYNLGGLYGLMLDGTDTRVPAHYHAVIGGINLAFMVFYHRVILPFISVQVREGKLFTAQYWLYGLGQIMHASGMFLAGSQGVPRKTAGDAQSLDNIEKILSMGLMGIGGLIAVIGGVLFVIMTMKWIIKGGKIYETT